MTTVAIALIARPGEVLICRRRGDQAHAGKWEFPGGKAESGEMPADALVRELDEELGIDATELCEVVRYDYAYPGKSPVRLVFFHVTGYNGRIDGSQFADLKWESCAALPDYDFLAGDGRIVRELADGQHLTTKADARPAAC